MKFWPWVRKARLKELSLKYEALQEKVHLQEKMIDLLERSVAPVTLPLVEIEADAVLSAEDSLIIPEDSEAKIPEEARKEESKAIDLESLEAAKILTGSY